MMRELGFHAATLGLVLAMAGVGMLPGTALAAPLRRRFGVGPTLIGAGFFASINCIKEG
jgi:ABC-type sugar transport system substrate-binding protein